MADLVLPCDHAALAAAVARLWPAAAAVAGVDPARVRGVVLCDPWRGRLWAQDRDGCSCAVRPQEQRAIEELARSLEDAHYAIRRDGSARVVLGEAAYAEIRGGVPGHCVDIDGWWWHGPGMCVGALANCSGKCCSVTLVRLADLVPWHPAAELRRGGLLIGREERDRETAAAPNAKLEHARRRA